MNYSKFYFVLLLALFSISINAQQQDEKAVAIINKELDAMGGKNFIKSIKTLYTNSETQMEGRTANWVVKEMKPNIGSFEIVYGERVVFKSWYDGKVGYNLSSGQKTVANQDNFKDKAFKKNIFNELDYLDPSLYKLEYLGTEDFESAKCHKVKATGIGDNKKVEFLYFDDKTSFLVKSETVKGEKDSFATVVYGDYKKFNKLTYFTTMRFGVDKDSQSAKIVELLYNEKVSEKDFQ
ncbi:hypothetical protein C8C83_3734 [Flavobacterium sp. 90]|uniref:hypothetical protein n=1 Tax=unclassified Flavobacterium TaxID=196869 RepID=UPI000EB41B28|nr:MULTISPECIES: hypothetical protein [unclassified Flavobacterium]RKR11976.1 hypothetical protein C8C82_4054 [Flavobacterium sp. 81]TCK55748.1 hypothetical protein C8C83_3734 [Flavobacterium sp. 90]